MMFKPQFEDFCKKLEASPKWLSMEIDPNVIRQDFKEKIDGCMDYFSLNPRLTWEIIENTPSKYYNIDLILLRKKFTDDTQGMERYLKSLDVPYRMYRLSLQF